MVETQYPSTTDDELLGKLEDWYGTSQKIVMWAQGMAQRREGLLVISSNSLGWEFLILKGSCKK